MDQTQIDSLFEVLSLFQRLGLSRQVVLIGSWAEYFYVDFFSMDYYPNLATRDIDLLYRNTRSPHHKVPLVSSLKELGFIYDENPLTKVARFYKDTTIELEFLVRVVGQDRMVYEIESIGITAEGLREINLLHQHCVEIPREEFSVFVPEPAAYVIHKILINEKRVKGGKAEKDMRSIKDLLIQIKNHPKQNKLFIEIIQSLSKKELTVFRRVCQNNSIDVPFVNDDPGHIS